MAFSDYLKLIRPINCILAAVGVFIGFSIAATGFSFTLSLGLAMLVVFLVCGAGQAVNDVFDLEVDRKLHPNKPLPKGAIQPQSALYFSVALFVLGNVIAYFLGFVQLIISVVFSLLLFLYAWKISRNYKFIGNWVVAFGTGFTLIYGASLVGNYLLVVYFALSAVLANLARELIKDLEDVEQDRGFKKTLPMVLPVKEVKLYVGLLYILAIVLSIGAYVIFSLNVYFIGLLALTGLVFVISFIQTWKEHYPQGQKFSKIGMVVALLAFLVTVL